MIDKIKDIIEDIKNEIKWVLAGMPRPVKIPVESKERRYEDREVRDQDR